MVECGKIDHEKTKVGYEIPFNRHFYVFNPPRELSDIDAVLKGVTERIVRMVGGLTGACWFRGAEAIFSEVSNAIG